MARPKKTSNTKVSQDTPVYANYVDKLENQVQSNQSKLSMVLGALIILVVGILVFNYFNKGKADLGPAQQTEIEGDVTPENLPGGYTVKEADTLFKIAEKYYGDGYKYPEIAKINNLTNADLIEKGQVLQIPKLETAISAQESEPVTEQSVTGGLPGSKGAPDITMVQSTGWGAAITEDKYTVVEGDWLSKIAGRAYGNIFAFDKIAKANNILNPNLIEPGMVLVIPR